MKITKNMTNGLDFRAQDAQEWVCKWSFAQDPTG